MLSALLLRSPRTLQFSRLASTKASNKWTSSSDWRRLLSLWRPQRRRILTGIGLLVVSSGVTMSVPFALGRVLDAIYGSIEFKKDEKKTISEKDEKNWNNDGIGSMSELRRLCLMLSGVFVLGGLCNFGRVYLLRVAGQNIANNLRVDLYGSMMRQPIAFFERRGTGELINRLASDASAVSSALTQTLSDGLRSVAMASIGVSMMVVMSPQLTAVGLALVPPVSLWAFFMGRRVRGISRDVQDSLAQANSLAEERISNIKMVQAMAKNQHEYLLYRQRLSQVLQKCRTEAGIHARFYGLTGLSGNVIVLSVLFYGGQLVNQQALTVGNLASFVLYAAYVGIGLNGLTSFYAEMMKALGASERIFEIIDQTPSDHNNTTGIKSIGPIDDLDNVTSLKTYKNDSKQLCLANDDIIFDKVDFTYPSRPEVKVLNQLDLVAKAHHSLAVVGGSGSGKSTLASLLLRLYSPSAGRILIGDRDVQELDVRQLRMRVSLVQQEPVLFSGSIAENIAYGQMDDFHVINGEIDMNLVQKAAESAHAQDFISALPKGYETLVGERGVMLSGGQKQRVAIARAIIRNPDILILDEATSALDSHSEALVQQALKTIMQNRTVIVIAHRLATIVNADQVAVMEGGRVVEQGDFQSLVSKSDGVFSQLVKRQHLIK